MAVDKANVFSSARELSHGAAIRITGNNQHLIDTMNLVLQVVLGEHVGNLETKMVMTIQTKTFQNTPKKGGVHKIDIIQIAGWLYPVTIQLLGLYLFMDTPIDFLLDTPWKNPP